MRGRRKVLILVPFVDASFGFVNLMFVSFCSICFVVFSRVSITSSSRVSTLNEGKGFLRTLLELARRVVDFSLQRSSIRIPPPRDPTKLRLSHIDDTSDARSAVHVLESLVNLRESSVVRDELVDPAERKEGEEKLVHSTSRARRTKTTYRVPFR